PPATRTANPRPHTPTSLPAGAYNSRRPRPAPVCCLENNNSAGSAVRLFPLSWEMNLFLWSFLPCMESGPVAWRTRAAERSRPGPAPAPGSSSLPAGSGSEPAAQPGGLARAPRACTSGQRHYRRLQAVLVLLALALERHVGRRGRIGVDVDHVGVGDAAGAAQHQHRHRAADAL